MESVQKKFKDLPIGTKFSYANEKWEKVNPVKATCCTLKLNAYIDGNRNRYRVFSDNTIVYANPEEIKKKDEKPTPKYTLYVSS